MVRKTTAAGMLAAILLAALAWTPRPAGAAAETPPPVLTVETIAWIRAARGGSNLAAISPGAAPEFTRRLVELYAAAAKQPPAAPVQLPFVPPRDYAPRLVLLTADRQLVSLRARPNSDTQVDISWQTAGGKGGHTVEAAALHALIAGAGSQFAPAPDLQVQPRDAVRMGTEQRISGGDIGPADALHVFLEPLRPGASEDAFRANIATYRNWAGGPLDLRLRLAGAVGALPDGSPLRLLPGPYQVSVVSEGLTLASGEAWGGFQIWAGYTLLLPEAPPPPRAVAVQGDRVFTWAPGQEVTAAAAQRPRRGAHQSMLVPSSLAPALGLAVTRLQPGSERWSAGDAAVTITAGEQSAAAGHGGLDLFVPAEAAGDDLVVNFGGLAPFFEYEVRWVGPETVFFLRGVAEPPPALLAAMGRPAASDVDVFSITINGKRLEGAGSLLIEGTTYLPLRAAGEALSAQVHWDAATRTGLLETAAFKVIATPEGVQVVRGGTAVPLPRGPVNREGRLYVPLRAVVEALDGQVVWDWEAWTIRITLTSG